jgi:hypothetical protein
MRKLVLSIIALLALFSALRAFPETVAGVSLQPGLVEVGDGASSIGIAFGAAEAESGASSRWSLLPLRVVYSDGTRTITIGLNGLSFLLRGGVTVGAPVRVDKPRSSDVISFGGKVTVGSKVDGDVWALGADVDLGAQAEVTGNVVVIGGKLTTSPKAVVRGSSVTLPELKIPFVGALATQYSVQVLAFGRQLLGYILLGLAIFLCAFYRTPQSRELYQALPTSWRESLVTLALCLVLVPLVTVLLVVSVIGIFFLPVLAFGLIVAGFEGFLVLCIRLGGILRRKSGAGAGSEPLWLLTSGLLGLFLVKVPALAGIAATLFRSSVAAQVGKILQLVTLGATAAGMLYGLAAEMARLRARAGK